MGEHNPGPYLVKARRHGNKGFETWAIVPIPSEPGRYMRTHPCVLEVACPHCGAPLGEPCRRKGLGRGSLVRVWHGRAVIVEPTRQRHRQAVHAARRSKAGRRSRTEIDEHEVPQREQPPLSVEWGTFSGVDPVEIKREDAAG